MKTLLFVFVFFFSNLQFILSQNNEETMKDENFYRNRGEFILKNTSKVLQKYKDTTYADFWNLALAHSMLKADENLIISYLKKSKSRNLAKFNLLTNDYIDHCGAIEKTYFYYAIGNKYLQIIDGYDSMLKTGSEQKSEAINNKIDSLDFKDAKQLVSIIIKMNVNDQIYRRKNGFLDSMELQNNQRIYDNENQEILDRLFLQIGFPHKSVLSTNYRNLIGKIFVHSPDVKFLNKWLPLMEKAYFNGDLGSGIFMIIVDKVHWLNSGKQIFGTQSNIDFEKDKIIKSYRDKYGL